MENWVLLHVVKTCSWNYFLALVATLAQYLGSSTTPVPKQTPDFVDPMEFETGYF